MPKRFEIIDLFAGPGGLGEGFSAAGRERGASMKVRLSVEKEATEVDTLRLRAFLRSFGEGFPKEYYQSLNSSRTLPFWKDLYPSEWKQAEEEARQLELGEIGVFDEIAHVLDSAREGSHGDTILIGGPPCQAYSLAGRSRNRGKPDYVPEDDHRHFLYREYVRILDRLRPAAFVMENVRGLLSSKVGGSGIFDRVIEDLGSAGDGYTLIPLTCQPAMGSPLAEDFLVRAEEHGVPQARHRIFVVGLRSDVTLPSGRTPLLRRAPATVSVESAIGDLPRLRSGLSICDDADRWKTAVKSSAKSGLDARNVPEMVRRELRKVLRTANRSKLPRQSDQPAQFSSELPARLRIWFSDRKLKVVLNHETRGHIERDIGRYLYVASFGAACGRSPKLKELPDFLQPEHRNRSTGAFADRFRVQLGDRPSSTITSHISKDGHYYIHPDPQQARSLTVREAARLQTFPDNYHFCGARTAQYHQVGNAVPPFLALQIGRIVKKLLD